MKEVKKTKAYWMYILLGVVLLVAAAIFAPVWDFWAECPWKDWGFQVVSYGLAALILIYLFGYLIKKVSKSSGTIQILTILEFILLTLIAVGLVFSQFKILNIPDSPSFILGIALYCRGVIEIFRAYYHQKDSKYNYSIALLIAAILFVTFGVFLMCTNLVTKLMVLIILVLVLFVLGVIALSYGIAAKPEVKKEAKKEKTKKSK